MTLEAPVLVVPSGWPGERPYIAVNMVMTIDGKITTRSRESLLLGSRNDWERMDQLRAQADGILNGAETIRRDNPPVRVRDAARIRERIGTGRPGQPANIVVTRSSSIPVGSRILREEGARVWLLRFPGPNDLHERLPESPESQALQGHEPVGEEQLTFTGPEAWREAMSALRTRGIHLLLAEGGAELNGTLHDLGLIDEMFLTVAPTLAGGRTAPTPIAGEGRLRESLQAMRLVSCETVGDEVFLRYRRR